MLIFASSREGGYGGGDLYVSYFEDGVWTEPVNLGPEVNTTANEFTPWVSADGRFLFFTRAGYTKGLPPSEKLDYAEFMQRIQSPQNGHGDIYYIETASLSGLR